MYKVRISTETPVILIEVLYEFSDFLQATVFEAVQYRPSSTSFPIIYQLFFTQCCRPVGYLIIPSLRG
jgi:hypothetical protein